MLANDLSWLNLVVALGIGLLIGAERERRKGSGPARAPAGIRTFALVALLGAASAAYGPWLLAATLFGVSAFAAIAYARRRQLDPGLTTEIALLLTLMLGALATSEPTLAGGIAVMVAALLTAREPIHRFVRDILTENELNDLLVLAAATLVVLPLVPDESIGPFDAINPRTLWIIVILVMLIGATGHVVLRLFGGRLGLPLVGLVSGFVSSAATIGAMGARASKTPALLQPAVAGAVLSTLATMIQMLVVLAAVSRPTLLALALPLACGGGAAALYGILITWRSLREQPTENVNESSALSLKAALILAATIAVMLILSAALKAWLGQAGLIAVAGVAGFADTHAAAISVAALAASSQIEVAATTVPILVAISTNTVTKIVMAVISGSKSFSLHVIPGLLIVAAATWFGWWLAQVILPL